MEDKMDCMSNKSADKQVDECLSHVRILSARPNLTQGHVLLAAIETLVTVATKLSHKEAEYFSKAYVHCKKYEDSRDLCSLALKLFGSAEDKKLANIVADWVKGKKYEVASPKKPVSVEIDSEKENRGHGASGIISSGANLPNGFNPYVQGGFNPYAQGGMFMNPYMFNPPFTPFQGGPPLRFGRGARGPNNGARRGRCLFCKELGHYVAECPKIKKE